MPKLTITIDIPDEKAALFEGRDLMITPVSDREAGQIGAVMLQNADVLDHILAASETPQDALSQHRERFVQAVNCLNRAVRYCQRPKGETVQ